MRAHSLYAFAFACFAAAPLSAGAAQAETKACGSVSIAEMNWSSAGLAAWVDKIILEKGYGCDASLISGDTVPTFTSMDEKEQPDIAPELWTNTLDAPLAKAVKEGRLVEFNKILTDGGVEGFWIPTWLSKEKNIKSVQDALKHPELFPGAEDKKKGAFFSCPSGWACQIITQNQYAALEGDKKGFELVDPGSAAGLDGAIARAFEHHQGWLGYYWAPTAILGKYEMTRLDTGAPYKKDVWDSCTSKPDCAKPALSDWPPSPVFTVVTKKFADRVDPTIVAYLKARSWSNDMVNKQLAWMTANQASNEDGAYHFLKSEPDLWTKWLSPDVAAKVKKAL